MQKIEAVILDMDGLMIDTERFAREAWRQAASEVGYTIDEALLTRTRGRTLEDGRTILLDALGQGFPYAEVRSRRDAYVREALERGDIQAMEGLTVFLETIDSLQLKKAIATSGQGDATSRKLAALGLNDSFGTVVCGDDIENGKPAPDIFLEAARRLDAEPSQCVVLEDSDAGARAADAAGMRVIVIPELRPPAPDVVSLAWRVLPSLIEAASLLADVCEKQAENGEATTATSASPAHPVGPPEDLAPSQR